ncbi:MAG TPA: type II toxin-antitoxin system VapB family antitoxin [Tepidisphaeraceae bacterium]|jgi:Arc/MetJ family transcription regulator
MPTNLHIDADLLDEAVRLGKHKTKRGAVNEALREYVQYRKQLKLLESAGTVDFDPTYDYKAQRQRSAPPAVPKRRKSA